MSFKVLDFLSTLRSIIFNLPETSETVSHGAPTFWAGKKTFAILHDGHYDNGEPAVWFKAAPDAKEALISADPDRFYNPRYVGSRGWVGLRLRRTTNWAELEMLLVDAFRLVAPKRVLAAFDGGTEFHRDAPF